ncbi:MAG: hypothetical protein R6U89_12610 [Dehalococcoidia bacterium]
MEDNEYKSETIDWKSWLLTHKSYVAPTTIEACIKQLEDALKNPDPDKDLRLEIALSAFCNAYFEGQGATGLGDELRERISNIIETVGGSDKEDIYTFAFVKLHLIGVLIVDSIDPSIPLIESERVVGLLSSGSEAINLLDGELHHREEIIDQERKLRSEVELESNYFDPDSFLAGPRKSVGERYCDLDLFLYSILLLKGIILVEKGVLEKQRQEYEQAFNQMADGSIYLAKATEEGPEPWLPHSGKPLDMIEVANLFEAVKEHEQTGGNVNSWETIAESCVKLADASSIIWEDGFGDEPGGMYWEKQEIICRLKDSESAKKTAEIISCYSEIYRDSIYKNITDKRLKRDVFPHGLWDSFEEETREHLIKAEKQVEDIDEFNDDFGGKWIDEFHKAVEIELPAVFPLLDGDFSKKRLNITLLYERLEGNKIIRDQIKSLKKRNRARNDDVDFVLSSLPDKLRELRKDRNYFAHKHERGNERKELSKHPMKTRQEWLGIDQQGIFQRLARIKKAFKADS